MKLYLIQYDGVHFYVEAEDFTKAIDAWGAHVAELWGDDYDGDEQPESVALIHEEPVIRMSEVQESVLEQAEEEQGKR